jgi:glutathione synthase/RimK-type ligase-like ATP-grasp enzyme
MSVSNIIDDSDQLDEAEIIHIQWPDQLRKPIFGIIQDEDEYPKWTRYYRFLANNAFEHALYQIHNHDWIEKSKQFDIIVGIPSNQYYHLQEIRNKYEILETYLGKTCYPSSLHLRLYEDKFSEAYISKIANIPFARTHIYHNKEDALNQVDKLKYPLVSKIIPSSGSLGVELVHNFNQAKQIIRQAFSITGRKSHMLYYQQKDYVYFQEFIPNDGYDIRVIVVGNWVFGSYRKAPPGDFRASGMKLEVRRELPEEAMKIARRVYEVVNS